MKREILYYDEYLRQMRKYYPQGIFIACHTSKLSQMRMSFESELVLGSSELPKNNFYIFPKSQKVSFQ